MVGLDSRMDMECVLMLMILLFGLKADGVMVGSTTFLDELPSYLLCRSRCQSKCYAENVSYFEILLLAHFAQV